MDKLAIMSIRLIDGLGDRSAQFKVYIANKPTFIFSNDEKVVSKRAIALETGEIHDAGQACGNGWRKVFNVYAKLVFALANPLLGKLDNHPNWQAYRDNVLLQANSNTALLFSPPNVKNTYSVDETFHIIMGKTYAKNLISNNHLGDPDELIWLNNEFAINRSLGVIVCPYFDYRQLSNVKIMYLVELIKSIKVINS